MSTCIDVSDDCGIHFYWCIRNFTNQDKGGIIIIIKDIGDFGSLHQCLLIFGDQKL